MIFSKRLRSQDHVREFVVDEADDRGWEVREEQDDRIVKRTWMHDWHRVENAMMRFALEAMQLQRAGWVEVPIVIEYRLNWDAGRQRFGDRRLIRYLEQLGLLLAIHRLGHRNLSLDSHGVRRPLS